MKKIIFLLLTVGTFYCKAQNSVRFDYDNFESQVLAYTLIKTQMFLKKILITE